MGGSVWELKIDPKRLREGLKNDIEQRRKKRDEKKRLKGDKKSSKKLWHRLARRKPGGNPEEVGAVWSPEAPREPPCARFDKQLKRLKEQRATF